MTEKKTYAESGAATVTLVVRRTIAASAERLFEAWTSPAQLMQWWGPQGVVCSSAEVELKVGGGYKLANRFPDGKLLWIVGQFELIDPPHRLVYTWSIGEVTADSERVTVCFQPREGATEVIVTHERIPNPAVRDMHEQGWLGCFDGLAEYIQQSR
jgi:uncharacterized protein YndB with AHSA1/START domain